MNELLSQDEIQNSLHSLHADWFHDSDRAIIERQFTFSDFYQTMAFANSVAWICHQQDHHPQLLITFKTCKIEFTTHDISGLTRLDFDCARAIDALVR